MFNLRGNQFIFYIVWLTYVFLVVIYLFIYLFELYSHHYGPKQLSIVLGTLSYDGGKDWSL